MYVACKGGVCGQDLGETRSQHQVGIWNQPCLIRYETWEKVFTYNIVTKTFANQRPFIILTSFDSHSIICSDI